MGGAPPVSVGPRLLTHVWQGGGQYRPASHRMRRSPRGDRDASARPPGWTAVLERTLPHFVKGPLGTTAVREMGHQEPPLSPEGPREGRMIWQNASGRAVPSPGALRHITLKK